VGGDSVENLDSTADWETIRHNSQCITEAPVQNLLTKFAQKGILSDMLRFPLDNTVGLVHAKARDMAFN